MPIIPNTERKKLQPLFLFCLMGLFVPHPAHAANCSNTDSCRYTACELDRIFDQYDKNRDGHITEDEFVAGEQNRLKGTTFSGGLGPQGGIVVTYGEKEIRAQFHALDTEHTGYLTRDNFSPFNDRAQNCY
jgi:hypothetical protein